MLLRICLILAILAGLGVIGVTQFKIRPQMQEIISTRDHNKERWDHFEAAYNESQDQLKTTQDTLARTERELETTKADLLVAQNRAGEQQRRADGLKTQLDATRAELNDAQQKLAAWDVLGYTVAQVKSVIDQKQRLEEAVEALEIEKKVLIRVNDDLQRQLELLLDPHAEPPLPPGLVGQVVAVDPKWEFVVLNVGRTQDVKINSSMLVVRGGNLVSKVRVTDVRNDSCIANILPGWNFGEVMEGDTVVPRTGKP